MDCGTEGEGAKRQKDRWISRGTLKKKVFRIFCKYSLFICLLVQKTTQTIRYISQVLVFLPVLMRTTDDIFYIHYIKIILLY